MLVKMKASKYVSYAAMYYHFYEKKIIKFGHVIAFNNKKYFSVEELKKDTIRQITIMKEENKLDFDISLEEAIGLIIK